jgi:hypothetical protein
MSIGSFFGFDPPAQPPGPPEVISVDELFERNPIRWGLRGDPLLWRDMRAALRGKPLPDTLEEAERLFEKTFARIVGVELGSPQPGDRVYVKKFATGSGISDGQVSLQYWRDTAMPILLDRFIAARLRADPADRFGLS